jgi:4-carboxymuconolactone decarboxylase
MSSVSSRRGSDAEGLAPCPASGIWIQYSRPQEPVKEDEVEEQDGRRARALARLAELGDEPGGQAFLERMGVLGDWIVDFAFGDVHTRPGLDARERELIIVAVLATIGSSDPQVRAHIRALRAIDVPWEQIEETILQITPYAGVPRAVNAIKVLRDEQEAQ